MADELGVKLVIEAENRASGTLQTVKNEAGDLVNNIDKLTGTMSRNREEVLAAIRAQNDYARLLKADVVPATKEAEQATTGLSGATSILTAAAAGAGAALGSLASMLARELVDSLRKSAEEAAKWKDAMSSADIDKITEAIKRQSEEVTKLGRTFQYFPRDRRFGPVLGPLEQGIEQLGEGQRWREYLQGARGYEMSEGDVARVTGQQEQQRIDKIKEGIREQQRAAARAATQEQQWLQRQLREGQTEDERVQREAEHFTNVYGNKDLVQARKEWLDQDEELYKFEKARLDLIKETEPFVDKFYRDSVAREKELAAEEKRAFEERAKAFEQYRKFLEETDFFTGLEKGFRDMTRGAGEIMQDFARNTARGMTQSFDDLFFNAMTGQFKKMADFGKQAGYALARSFSGALAEFLVGGATRGVGSLLRGGTGAGLIPVATAAGTVLVPGSSAASVQPAGIPGTAGGGIMDLLTQGVGGLGSTVAGWLGLTSPGAAPAAAGLVEDFGVGITGLESAGAAAGTGIGVSGTLGVVGAGIGFLASLYAAYQTRSPVMGGVTGALSGAVTGLTIGTTFGSVIGPGYGTLIGLVAGAALGAGAGALGAKGRRRFRPQEGEVRLQATSSAQNRFVDALNRAQTGSDLVTVLNTIWGPQGEFVIVASASDGSRRDPQQGIIFTYADIFDPSVQQTAEVRIWFYSGVATQGDLTAALRQKIVQIAQVEGGVQAAYREVGPGLSRTTFLPFGAIAGGSGAGQAFFFSSDAARNGGAPDANIASIIREITRVNSQQDILPDLTEQRFLAL